MPKSAVTSVSLAMEGLVQSTVILSACVACRYAFIDLVALFTAVLISVIFLCAGKHTPKKAKAWKELQNKMED